MKTFSVAHEVMFYSIGVSSTSFRYTRRAERRKPMTPQFLPINSPSSFQSVRTMSTSVIGTPRLTHIDSTGRASMVNVADKTPSKRSATATGRIYIPQVAYELITSPNLSDANADNPEARAKAKARGKGDVLTVAQLAAIMGAKRTSDLIPLCHPLALSHISVTLTPEVTGEDGAEISRYSILCNATVSCEGKTGVEMEALTAVSVGTLTVWDMLKAVAGKEMVIGDIKVTRKEGGKSGDFFRGP